MEISSVLKEAVSGDLMVDEVGHLMRLGDGQRWHIWACEDLRHWVEKLASIMQLEISEPNGYPKLIFIRKQPANKNACIMLKIRNPFNILCVISYFYSMVQGLSA